MISSDPADLWRELVGRARPTALDGDDLDRAPLLARLTISTCPWPAGPVPNPLIPSPVTITCTRCGQPFICDATSTAARDQTCGPCATGLTPADIAGDA